MSRNLEELLREGIDRATADTDAQAPATLLHRARQRNRRRRQAITAALATGAAAATAAAVIAATSLSGTGTNALPGQTITYVTTRAEQALSQLNQSNAIEQETLTARNGVFDLTVLNTGSNGSGGSGLVPGVLSGVHANREVDWTYHGLLLQQGFGTDGKLIYTSTIGANGASGAAYPAHVQWHNSLSGGQSGPNPALTCANAGMNYPNWQQSVKKALSCHLFSLDGSQLVGGVDTIKLTGKPVTGQGESFRQTLWVDPKTYLPLRISVTFTKAHQQPATLTHNFRWLAPTQANLGALRAASGRGAIPATFRALPSTYLPLPGFDEWVR